MFLPFRRGNSLPTAFERLSSAARSSRKRMASGAKSFSASRLRLRRLKLMGMPRRGRKSDRIALDRARHAVAAAAAAAEFGSGDGDHLDAGLAQQRVGV